MTREERIQFCKVCENKQLDFKEGLSCKLTGNHADFEDECIDFKLIQGKKVVKKKSREKSIKEIITNEKITKKDLYIILAFSFFLTFLFRFFQYSGIIETIIFYFFPLVYISFCCISVLRYKSRKKIHFLEDIKYRLIYSFLFIVINDLYKYLVYDRNEFDIKLSIYIFLIIFGFSFFSIPFTKLYFLIFRNKRRNDEIL